MDFISILQTVKEYIPIPVIVAVIAVIMQCPLSLTALNRWQMASTYPIQRKAATSK